jgi:hypothetical protein
MVSVLPVIAAVSVAWEDDQFTADFADGADRKSRN